jgi:hypothetical protein
MTQWQYKTVAGQGIGWLWEDGLNELGDKGWELVHIHDKGGHPIYYLKRQLHDLDTVELRSTS